jgi:hypothetical protein
MRLGIGDDRYANLPAVGSEFHGIVQQILDDVCQPFRIGFDARGRSIVDRHLQIDRLACRRSTGIVNGLCDHVG